MRWLLWGKSKLASKEILPILAIVNKPVSLKELKETDSIDSVIITSWNELSFLGILSCHRRVDFKSVLEESVKIDISVKIKESYSQLVNMKAIEKLLTRCTYHSAPTLVRNWICTTFWPSGRRKFLKEFLTNISNAFRNLMWVLW